MVSGTELAASCHLSVIVPLDRIELPEEVTLTINAQDTASLSAALYPADATGVVLAYESSDEAVATVDLDGRLHAVSNGVCAVKARVVSADDAGETPETKTVETTVTVETAPISLAVEDATLTIGYGGSLEVVVEGENLTIGETFTWASGDDSIVTVDGEGAIKGAGIGTATVTVTNELGQSATCTVTVKNIVCAYCGQEGHGSGSCQKKKDDEAAAAAAAAAQAAAQAAQAAQGGGGASGGGTSGGGSYNGHNPGDVWTDATGRPNYTITMTPGETLDNNSSGVNCP